jgi:hypothetical protein
VVRSKINIRFVRFRLVQAGKFFREIPLPYLIILLMMAGVGLYVVSAFFKNPAGAAVCGGVLVAAVWFVHLRRRDYHFICMVDERAWRVFFVDYLLFSIPFLLLLLWREDWIVVMGVVAGYAGISLIRQPFRRVAKGFPVPDFIPFRAFEVRVLFRRYGGLLVVLYLGAFVGLLVPYASFAPLWFYLAFLSEGFRDCEARALLNSYEMPAKRFLHYKIRLTAGLYCIVAAPVCVIYTVIRPGDWWLALGFLVLAVLNVILCIVAKYALFEPGKKIVSGQISMSLSFIGVFVPFLAPLTLFLLIRYYLMARKNLTPYLYAYN